MSDVIMRLNGALDGRYVVERKLGEGGMAVVYIAEDLRHERKVALKVLKSELAAVVGGERFLAEIKTTAHLQHPHILPLFDSGEADGFLFYVMPYVEDESLRERLDREKQLPVNDAVRIATDVAEALQAAHEEGVLHRDIKPANILLRKGKPLVADFGIALAVSAAGGGRLTETGLSLGTPHYMSPEQATGDRDPTAASDVYSLGCVLYEMLTGEPPFGGTTAQAVLARILTGEPDVPTSRRKAIPPNVEGTVLRALERLPPDRFGSARDFAAALADPSFRHGQPVDATADSGASRSAAGWRTAAITLGVLAVASGAWGITRGAAEPDVATRHRVALFDWDALDEVGALSGSVRYGVGIAPDGSALVLRDLEPDRLLLKERNAVDAVPIAGTEGGFGPVFSPDGEWIAFFSSTDNTVRKVPRRGGASVVLTRDIAVREQQLAWLDDGRIAFTALSWHLDAVPSEGGEVERLVDVTGTGRFVTGVTPLPEARGVLFVSCDASCPNPEVRVLDLRTGEERTLIPRATGAWFLSSGHLLFVMADGSVFVQPFDLDRLELSGATDPALEPVATQSRRADLAATWDGTVVYLQGRGIPGDGSVEPTWVDLDGTASPVVEGWRGTFGQPSLSPDGRHLAYTEGLEAASSEIRVRELPDGPITPLTTDTVQNRRALWGLDAASVIYQHANERFDVRRADASKPSETLLDLEHPIMQVELSGDGRWLLYRVGDANQGLADLWLVDLAGDSTGRPLLDGDFNELAAHLSPDGRWIAYLSQESGRREAVIRPFPNVRDAQYSISVEGAGPPHWAPDGRSLYYLEPGPAMMIEAVLDFGEGLRVVERRELFSAVPFLRSADHWQYDLSPDGTRFLMLRATAAGTGTELVEAAGYHVLVENLLAELKGR